MVSPTPMETSSMGARSRLQQFSECLRVLFVVWQMMDRTVENPFWFSAELLVLISCNLRICLMKQGDLLSLPDFEDWAAMGTSGHTTPMIRLDHMPLRLFYTFH